MKKPKVFRLHVYQIGLDKLNGFEMLEVAISTEYARKLLGRMNLVQALQQLDSNLFKIVYNDDSMAGYFASDSDDSDNNPIPKSETESATDSPQIVVYDSEVRWCATPRDAQHILESDTITYEDLEEIL